MTVPEVPIWIAASGQRMLGLTARYAQGWNGGSASNVDGEPFVTKLASLRAACRAIGREPDELEASSFTMVIVSPDDHACAGSCRAVERDQRRHFGRRGPCRYVLGTPDQVVTGLRQAGRRGVPTTSSSRTVRTRRRCGRTKRSSCSRARCCRRCADILRSDRARSTN